MLYDRMCEYSKIPIHMKKTLYEILNISSTATLAEIKKAYRQLCKMHHPDKNQGSTESENLFKQINEAYHVLSDKDSREKYDREIRNEKIHYSQSNVTWSFLESLKPVLQVFSLVVILVTIAIFIFRLGKVTKS